MPSVRRPEARSRAIVRRVVEEVVSQRIELPTGELHVLQPSDSAELPDDGSVEWAPIAPYWAVLWRSGVALARELDRERLEGLRVIELGCGLAMPTIVAARRGAAALATDVAPEALALADRNARENGVRIETARLDWSQPGELAERRRFDLAERRRFDLALAADVLYERSSVASLLSLLPRLAPAAWVADPGRSAAGAFLGRATERWRVETRRRGVVELHRLEMG